jgi:AcrR family transcriptional regulator
MMTTPRPTLRDRRRAELRQGIVLAALRLFADRGFDEVTVDEIAVAAGISLSTLFRHVASKDDMLVDVVRTGRAMIVANFQQRPATEPVRDSLAHAILRRTEQFTDETETIELWRRAMGSAPPRVRRAALLDEQERSQLIGLVAARLALAAGDTSDLAVRDTSDLAVRDTSDLAAGDTSDLAAGVLVQTKLAAAEYAYDYWLRRPPRQTLHQLTRRALDIAAASGSPASR